MNPLWIIFGILLITYMIYKAISYALLPKHAKSSARIGAEQINLSKVTQVIASEELNKAWTTTDGSTLMFFIFPEITDRTSVSGNEYANVIQIGTKQNFKLLVAPDAGRGYSMAPAVLEVFLKGSSTPEIIDIPHVPLQRWTSVVIVKNGRKFNIYINGILRASHMCTAMPDFDATQPLRTGDLRLGGSIALMSILPYPMQTNDVRSYVAQSVDTTGKPYLSSGMSFPVPDINVILSHISCPGGNCVTPKQSGPMEEWSSPYA